MSNPVIIEDTIKAGEPTEILFSVWENGYEVNIADFALSILMRRDKLVGGPEVARWGDESEAVTRDDETGKVTLKLTAQFTAELKAKTVFLDCWLSKVSNGDGYKSGVVQLNIDHGVPR